MSILSAAAVGAGCSEQLLELGTGLVLGSHKDNAHTEDADQQGRGVSKCAGITCLVLLSRFVNISHVPAFLPPLGSLQVNSLNTTSLPWSFLCVCVPPPLLESQAPVLVIKQGQFPIEDFEFGAILGIEEALDFPYTIHSSH